MADNIASTMPETPQWKIYTGHDAIAPRPPIEYLINGYFQRSSLNMIYGPPGGLKTMVASDCAACVASGKPWLPGALGDGAGGIETKQAPILWVDIDNGAARMHERMGAAIRAHDVPLDSIHYISMPTPALDLTNFDISAGLIVTARDQLGAGLIVVDNLGRLAGAAGADVNSSQMDQIMGTLRTIAERTTSAVVVIHHQRKSGTGNGHSKVREGETILGHTSIEASLDLALLVMRDGNSQDIIIKSTKSRGVEPPIVGARFYYTHVEGTNQLETAWFKGAAIGSNRMEDVILDAVDRRGRITKGLLVDEVRDSLHPDPPGPNQVRNRMKQMIIDGVLSETRDGNSHYISRSDGLNEGV